MTRATSVTAFLISLSHTQDASTADDRCSTPLCTTRKLLTLFIPPFRLTNAFSKKLENHAQMVALYALWYNFVRIHKTLRMTPAMAAGIETRLWSMEDVVRLIEEREDLRSGALLVG
jgi:hypothetical protein